VHGQDTSLTPMEFNLLATLMAEPGRVFTRQQLVDTLADSGFAGLERTLNVHVRNLRTKIEWIRTSPVILKPFLVSVIAFVPNYETQPGR
jgi:DNA-binding response OmpR family regulator